MTPSLSDRRCPLCWTPFTPTVHNPQQRYCRPACRVEQWRGDRAASQPAPLTAPASRPAGAPCRDDSATTTPPERCPVCQTAFTRTGRQRFCSDACRKTAWRRRHPPTPVPAPAVVPARRRQRDVTIYACPDCHSRYLAQQWCSACNKPCRRIGLGGPCPNCHQPVAVSDLFDTDTPTEVRPPPTP